MTTAGGGHRKRKTIKSGLEVFCGARPSIFIRTGEGWECSDYQRVGLVINITVFKIMLNVRTRYPSSRIALAGSGSDKVREGLVNSACAVHT